MTTLTWTPTSLTWVSVMSTELNSLANTATAITSTSVGQIDNIGAVPATHVVFELAMATISASAAPYVTLFLVPENSDKNGTYISDTDAVAGYFNYPNVGIALQVSALQAPRQITAPTIIYPMKYRVAVVNAAGVAFAASGNTVKYALFNQATS